MKNDNRGLSLIEMVVTVAIIAVFSGVVLRFMTVGSNSYRNTSSTARVQMETQNTLDAMQDLLISTNRGICYAKGSASGMEEAIGNDLGASDSVDRILVVCNKESETKFMLDVLEWKGESGEIYCSRYEADGQDSEGGEGQQTVRSGSAGSGGQIGVQFSSMRRIVDPFLFAEGIECFSADVTKTSSDKVVRFQLDTDENGKKISTIHTVNLRNRVQVLSMDNLFGSDGGNSGTNEQASIRIVNAPSSIEQGESKILDYYVTGRIDPATVEWKIISGPGSFPVADKTFGKLTAGSDSAEPIVVQVTAKTSDGGEVQSQQVSIAVTIPVSAAQLIANKEKIVVGAGNGLSLRGEGGVSWRRRYSNGTQDDDNESISVTYEMIDSGRDATITPQGYLVISPDAGQNSQSIRVRATNGGVSGTLEIVVARLDLTFPKTDYEVGEAKPTGYSFKIGGSEAAQMPAPAYTALYKANGAEDFQRTEYPGSAGMTFTDENIGTWKIRAQFDLKDYKYQADGKSYDCYGTVSSERMIQVIENTSFEDGGTLYIGGGDKVLVKGGTYSCYLSNNDSENYGIKLSVENLPRWSYSVEWSVERTKGTTIQNNNGTQASLTVGEDEDGFVLKAVYKEVCNPDDNGSRNRTIIVRKYIDVLKSIDIIGPEGTLEHGKKYPVGISIKIGTKNPQYPDGEYIESHTVFDADWGIKGGGCFTQFGSWEYNSEKKQYLYKVDLHNSNDILKNQKGTIFLHAGGDASSRIFVAGSNIPTAEKCFDYTGEAVEHRIMSNTIEFKANQELSMSLELTRSDGDTIPERNVFWEIFDSSNNLVNKITLPSQYRPAEFCLNSPGTYTIRAKYYPKSIDAGDNEYYQLSMIRVAEKTIEVQ